MTLVWSLSSQSRCRPSLPLDSSLEAFHFLADDRLLVVGRHDDGKPVLQLSAVVKVSWLGFSTASQRSSKDKKSKNAGCPTNSATQNTQKPIHNQATSAVKVRYESNSRRAMDRLSYLTGTTKWRYATHSFQLRTLEKARFDMAHELFRCIRYQYFLCPTGRLCLPYQHW